jgi:serine/threonine-protein kinase
MLQEARRIARVRHPHVVHVYGAERHEERVGLWMELVRGESLDAVVTRDGPLSADAAARIGTELCGAVGAVHAAGLLHRDIKAQNVIRDESGRHVLMDFGAGEERASARPRVTGTPLYIAPEILAGGAASVASDVYSLGVLLFYLTTGAFPVQASSVEGLAAAHRSRARRTLRQVNPNIPAGFARVVDRALSEDPSARYGSAAELEQALRRSPALAGAQAGGRGLRWRGWASALVTAASVAAMVVTVARPRTEIVAAGTRSLAVLPLTTDAGAPEAALLADGLTRELIATLGQLRDVRVTAHTSVSALKGTTRTLEDVARQLGVEDVLQGSLAFPQAAGAPGRVRVSARLVEAGTGVELWSGSVDGGLGDLDQLQRDLARGIARRVHARLSASEQSRLQTAHVTNPEAEQAYIEGRGHLAQFGARAGLALEAFRRALTFDAAHPGAHAGAARSYIALGFDRTISQAEARASALAEATRAVELDRDLAEGHGVLADLHFYYDWDFAAAEREYRRALDLEPSASYVRAQYAQFLAAMGRRDEAREQITESVARDPLSAQAELTRALILYYGREYDAALASVGQAETLDPTLPTSQFLRARILEARGDLPGASRAADRAIGSSAVVALGWRVQALRLRALQGDVQGARAGFRALAAGPQGEHLRASPHESYLRLATGEPDAAIAVLQRAVTYRDPSVLWLDVDPRLDVLRDRPAFAALRRGIGLP